MSTEALIAEFYILLLSHFVDGDPVFHSFQTLYSFELYTVCQDTTEDPLPYEQVRDDQDECDHSFVLKDDLGYVCRICGVIQRSIETIIEYQYAKVCI